MTNAATSEAREERRAKKDALERDVQLLHEIRDRLASQTGSDVAVGAVTGLIEERQAELERSFPRSVVPRQP